MKKTLLSLGMAALSFGAFSQSSGATGVDVQFDGTTPCQLANAPAGTINVGAAGGDFTAAAYNATDGTADFTVNTNTQDPAIHGPYYWNMSNADSDGTCDAANTKATFDISANPTFKVRIRATEDMPVTIFIQEGINPSYSYSKFSANALQMDLTTDWQEFTIDAVADTNALGDPVDLTQIGMIAIGFTDPGAGNAWPSVTDGVVQIDYYQLGDQVSTSLSAQAEAVNFTAYPNPATSTINFSSDVKGTIELANALGSVVTSTEGTSLNVAELPAGVYFATLVVDGVATAVQRIQVQ